jgi:membrane-associated phospholipid phosphatase
MPEGGHHLIDVIAGAAIVGMSAFLVVRRTAPALQSAGAPA